MTKQERLYFILAALPVLLQCTKPPGDYWGWTLLLAGVLYQGLLAVKAKRESPDQPTTQTPDTMKPNQIAKSVVGCAIAAGAIVAFSLLAGCAPFQAYEHTVAARQVGAKGNYDAQTKTGEGDIYYRVEYRSFK